MYADHEQKMNLSRREIHILLLHEFRLGHKATEAANNICSTIGGDVLSIRMAQHWFNRFKNGNLELDDLPRPGRPLEVDVDLLQQLPRSKWVHQILSGGYLIRCHMANRIRSVACCRIPILSAVFL